MTGVAVKVTEVPAQTGFADGAMDTLTGNNGLTVMFTTFEVAGFPLAHGSLDVKTQEIASPFAGT